MFSEGERDSCVSFFCKLFNDGDRRRAWFYRWLNVISKKECKTIQDGFAMHIECILFEPVQIQIHRHGLQLTESIMIPNEALLKDELTIVRWMHAHPMLLFQNGYCVFNYLISSRYRDLLFRDYIQLCFQWYRKKGKKSWPTHLLIVIQRLIIVQKKQNPSLHEAQRILQGYKKPENWII